MARCVPARAEESLADGIRAPIVMANIGTADIIMAQIVMANIVMVCIGMAHIGMARIVMAHTVMANIVMVRIVKWHGVHRQALKDLCLSTIARRYGRLGKLVSRIVACMNMFIKQKRNVSQIVASARACARLPAHSYAHGHIVIIYSRPMLLWPI